MPAKPRPTAFDHFWSFLGHICAENRLIPLLDYSGSLMIDGVRYQAVRYGANRSELRSGHWEETVDNLWATRRQVHGFFEKYYRLRNHPCSATERPDSFPHRLLQSYGRHENPTPLFLLVSVVAYYDVVISKPASIERALNRIKPPTRKKK